MGRLFLSTVNSFVQAIVYGIYITTLAHCMRWLVYDDEGRKRREKLNAPMLVTALAVFLLQTAGLATCFQTTLELSKSQGNFALVNLINSAMEYAALQIVDAVLIYRCWVVYAYSWPIVCLPIVCWISSVALSSYDIYLYSLALHVMDTDAANKLSNLTLQIWDGFFACNITINIYATVAIVYRILRVTKNSPNTSSRLSKTLRIIAESGALYTISTVVNLVATIVIGQDQRYELFQVIADPINFSMAGIAFNLILIRVGQQRAMSQGLSANTQLADKQSRWLSAIRFHQTKETDTSPSQERSTLSSTADYQDA